MDGSATPGLLLVQSAPSSDNSGLFHLILSLPRVERPAQHASPTPRGVSDGARGPRLRQQAYSLRQRIPAIPQRQSGVLRTRRDAPSSHGRAPHPVSDRRRCAARGSGQRPHVAAALLTAALTLAGVTGCAPATQRQPVLPPAPMSMTDAGASDVRSTGLSAHGPPKDSECDSLRWLSFHAYLPSGELAPTELAERCNGAALDKMQASPLIAYFELECGRPIFHPENSPHTWPLFRRSEEDGFLSFSPAVVDFNAGAAGRLQWFASGEMDYVKGHEGDPEGVIYAPVRHPPRCAPNRVESDILTQFTLSAGSGVLQFVRAPQKAKRSQKNTGALTRRHQLSARPSPGCSH